MGLAGLIIGFAYVKVVMVSEYQSTAILKFEGTAQIEGMQPTDEALSLAADALRRQALLRKLAEEIDYRGELTSLGYRINYQVDRWDDTVQITVPGETAENAAEFARIVVGIFTAYHEERQAERIEIEIGRIDQRITAAKVHAEAARRRYDGFREAHGIADLDTEQESMMESAARLRADSELAVSEIRALEAEVKSLETELASTPKTQVVSGGDSPEQAAYLQLRRDLATARATLSESHPRVQALQQQVNQFRAQLRSGGTTSRGEGEVTANSTHGVISGQLRTAKSNLEVLRERQRWLVEMADKAQKRVEGFSDIEGEASALLSDVKVAETLHQGLKQTEAALEDALRNPSSGFLVLEAGSVPDYPVANKMKLVIFAAVPMLLFGLALLFVLGREFRGLRVETPPEIAFWGGGPVLGTTSWPNDPHGLEELVAGLDDHAPDAKGSILVIGGSENETPLAVELVTRMNNDWVITGRAPGGAGQPSEPVQDPTSIQTPPPSGPYPISRSSQSTAIVRHPSVRAVEAPPLQLRQDNAHLEAWEGALEGQALRRAARIADRVVVLVHSGALSALQLNAIQSRLGRKSGIGYIVVGLPEALKSLQDRVGDVSGFWWVRG